MDEMDRKERVLAGKKLLAEQMLKRKSKAKKKKKAKTSGNVSTDVESSFLDDSSAVNDSVNDGTGANALENSHFAPNHDGKDLKNDVVPHNPLVDGDLQNFIDQLDAIDTDQSGNWEDPYDRTHPQDGHASQRLSLSPQPFVNSHPPHVPDSTTNSVTTTGSGEQPPENSLMPTNRHHHHAPSSLSDHFSSGTESSTLPSENFASAISGNNDFPYENLTHNALSGFLPNHSTQSVNHTGITTSSFGNNSPLENSSIPTNHSTLDLELRMKNSQDTIAQLQNEVITLQNERKLAQNELNLLRENQSELLQRCRREYEQKLANLQQELIDKEHQMQSLELKVSEGERERRELEETRSMEVSQHEQKLAHMLSEHEKMHAEMLSERDRRHAEELARVRAESANAMPTSSIQSLTVGGGEMERDSTELEAERIRIMKQTLNDLHEAEKAKMKVEHGEEMERLRADLQKQCDAIYQNAVTSANSQLQEMYAQYSAANTNLEGQKKSLEAAMERKNEEIARWQNLAETAERERLTSEEQYQQLLESKSAEIRVVRENSMSLETQLKDWTEKAALLEANMAKSEDYSRQEMEAKSGEQEEAFTRATADFESRISALQSQVETWKVKLHQAELKHQEELGNSVTRLREENSAQIEEINKSNQRKVQEMVMDYEDRLSRMKDEHSSQVNTLETSLNERTSEVDLLQSEHKTEKESLQVLQGQLKEYRNQERSFDEILHRMEASHKEEIDKLQIRATKELEGFFAKYEQQIGELKSTISKLTSEGENLKSHQRDLLSELELAHRQKTELTESLQRKEQEKKQLAQDCDRFQNKSKNLEVELSISKSAEEQNKLAMERAREQDQITLQDCQEALAAKEDELVKKEDEFVKMCAELESIQSEVAKLGKEKQGEELELQQVIDQLAAKSKSLADLQAENDDLKTSIDTLSRKQSEYYDECVKLQSQLESSWGVNEELESLKDKVAELTPYRDTFEANQLKIERLQHAVQAKEESEALLRENEAGLKGSLETASRSLQERTEEISCLEEALAESRQKAEGLENDVARLLGNEDVLKEEMATLESKNHTLIQERQQALDKLQSKLTSNISEMDEMRSAISDLQSQVDLLTSRDESLVEELAEKEQALETLQSKLTETMTSGESELTEINQVVIDLQSRLAASDADLAKKSHVIESMTQNLEELESKLSLANAEVTDLQADKSQLELDLLHCQSNTEPSTTEVELQELALKHSKLQCQYEELRSENDLLKTEVSCLHESSSKPTKALEAKIKEQEKVITDLQEKLRVRDLSSRPTHSETDFSRSPLESTLSRARQSLTEKLQEKAAIEKELGIRRAHLERQKAEKQYLEDLLLEKKRFEQELQRQKSDLLSELQVLEGKMSLGSSRDSSTKGGSLPSSILSSGGSRRRKNE